MRVYWERSFRPVMTAVGAAYNDLPIFSQDTDELIGFYSDAAVFKTANGGDTEDCVGRGLYRFFGSGPHEPMSQLSFYFTCSGTFNSITGGSGMYGCGTTGQEGPFEFDDDFGRSTITICGPTCTDH